MEFPYFFAKYGDKEAVGTVRRQPAILDSVEAKLLLRQEDDGQVLDEILKDVVLKTLQLKGGKDH